MAVARAKPGLNGYRSRGVALLMSLSVVLLLSIALMKTFEKRSLEVAQLGHNLDRFQAESLSRSGLKLILFSIKRAGLPTVSSYLEQLKLIEFPLGNGFMKIREITPVDHRFNLNTKISKAEDPRVGVFRNLVSISKLSANDYNYLSSENSYEALSAIIDWTDKNEMRDTVFMYGPESYQNEEPSFAVKNREFDRLSEVRLLPAFRSLGFTSEFLEQNFRTTDTTGEDFDEFIDVNLTPEADMERFLKRFENVEGYSNLFERSDDIIRVIMATRKSGDGVTGTSGFTSVDPPFPAKGFEREWSDRLDAEGIVLTKGKELFKPSSTHLFIYYQISVGRVTLHIRSMVKVTYKKVEKNLDIGELTILWLKTT